MTGRSIPPPDWPAPKRQRQILVDWVCFHAEGLEEAQARPVSDTSWAEWRLARGEAERALRH